MKKYDIVFLGHMCFDEIIPYAGEKIIAPGSAVLCGAITAARLGKKTAVIVKMANRDEGILEPMRSLGIDTYIIPSSETTYSKVIHETENPDERRLILEKSAGLITVEECSDIFADIQATCLHFAGISDTEFNLSLLRRARDFGCNLSVDMQSFVRQVDPLTKEIAFRDVAEKRTVAGLMERIKLDVVEARVLTGEADLEAAAKKFEEWGCPETMITYGEGVLLRAGGSTYREIFTNRTLVGRTGRGDTTFAAYLSRRLDYSPGESLAFAAALVSIKMETPGPFSGSVEDVLIRMCE